MPASKTCKYRFSCWTGTAFCDRAAAKVRRLGYNAYVPEDPAYVDYVRVDVEHGESRDAVLKELNERLHANGCGPGDYLSLTFN